MDMMTGAVDQSVRRPEMFWNPDTLVHFDHELDTWHVYDRPARQFLLAAARGDSLTLLHRGSTRDAASWALSAARSAAPTAS